MRQYRAEQLSGSDDEMNCYIRLEVFCKDNDELIREFKIDMHHHDALLRLCRLDNLIDGFMLTEHERPFVEACINSKINLEAYDYILELVEDRILTLESDE